MKITENNIIESLKSGEEQAFRYIYDKYYGYLCAIAKGYLSDNDAAETVVGDVIYNIWEIRKNLNIHTSLRSYIENYLPFLDEPYRNLFRLQMMAIGKLNERIRHDEPLVEFANQVSNTDNLIDMNAMAKLAVEEDIPIGRNRLFRWLRENEILMSGNLPYQKYIDRGYFAVKESVFEMDSMCRTYQQTFVTGKGQQYIIGRLKKEFCNEI